MPHLIFPRTANVEHGRHQHPLRAETRRGGGLDRRQGVFTSVTNTASASPPIPSKPAFTGHADKGRQIRLRIDRSDDSDTTVQRAAASDPPSVPFRYCQTETQVRNARRGDGGAPGQSSCRVRKVVGCFRAFAGRALPGIGRRLTSPARQGALSTPVRASRWNLGADRQPRIGPATCGEGHGGRINEALNFFRTF
jgi:hypothetical protein